MLAVRRNKCEARGRKLQTQRLLRGSAEHRRTTPCGGHGKADRKWDSSAPLLFIQMPRPVLGLGKNGGCPSEEFHSVSGELR